jgi:outer membrane receptor protein involved in Fe transport
MDFDLSPEHELLRDTVRQFALEKVAPVAEELDREHRFRYEILAELAELGLLGMTIPEEYGGAGTDTLSYALPKHTLHFDLQFRYFQFNNITDTNPRGSFTFTGSLTQNKVIVNGLPATDPLNPGSPFADFLLGLPQSTQVRFGSTNNYLRSWGIFGYVSDDWHVNTKLTVNMGLRYEFMNPATELFGHLANLDVNSAFSQVAVVTPGMNGPFTGALPNSLIHPDHNDWGPGIGIAWRVPGKWFQGKHAMTLRTGYSIKYNSQVYNTLANSLLNQPPWATALSPRPPQALR